MIYQLLDEARQLGASDVHFVADSVPRVRINGSLQPMSKKPYTVTEMEQMVKELLSDDDMRCLSTNGQVDCAVGRVSENRFRLNVFRQRGSIAMAVRIIPERLPICEELGLPSSVSNITYLKQGLVLIGGPTGSGKSTTMAALINKLNSEQQLHIITLEDPIEYIYPSRGCLINQREIGRDTDSFASGLRAALREDPDVILVGELRDAETMATALMAAETGHLVIATIHVSDAVGCINRILDMLPAQQTKAQLSDCLQGIVCQRLITRSDGHGRVGAFEVLVGTEALRSLIREGRTHQISSYIQTGTRYGMMTMNGALEQLRRRGLIE